MQEPTSPVLLWIYVIWLFALIAMGLWLTNRAYQRWDRRRDGSLATMCLGVVMIGLGMVGLGMVIYMNPSTP